MFFISWSLAHFISITLIATAIASAMLPFVLSSTSEYAIRKIAFLMGISLYVFILISIFYWIAPPFLPLLVLHFQQPSLHLLVATLLLTQTLIFHAILNFHENITVSLCASAAITAGLILLFVFPLEEKDSYPFFAIIITASFFVDLLIFSQIIHKNYFVGKQSFHTFFIGLNAGVMIVTSAAISYDISDSTRSVLLIFAALIASGLIPTFSYWRYVTISHISPPPLYITAFQTLLTIHILSAASFSALPEIQKLTIILSMLALTLILSVIPDKKNRLRNSVRAIAASMITASVACSIYFPQAISHIETTLLLSIPSFILLCQQKRLPSTPIFYFVFLFLILANIFFYLPIIILYQPTSITLNAHYFSQLSEPTLFFALLATLTLYNAYTLLPFLRAKRTFKDTFIENNNTYTILSAIFSVGLLHSLFILVPN